MHVSFDGGGKNKELEDWAEKNKHLFDGDHSVNYVSPTQVPEYIQHVKDKQDRPTAGYGGSGGGAGGGYTTNPYADYLDQINRMREQQLARQKAQAQAQYDARVGNINKGADEILCQAYVSKMQDARQLPQQLKAVGISGGASETTLQNMGANYANNRNNTEGQRMQSIDEAAQDRDAMNSKSYNDFLESNIATLQSAAQQAMAQQQSQARRSGGGKGGGDSRYIKDGGRTFKSVSEWTAYRLKLGDSDDEIKELARTSGII
ncbi:MAG: hypothetical protein RR846_07455 [Oscillospiraceae bacterium]